MCIVRHHHKPDLFITFTCNPSWPEINEALKKMGQEKLSETNTNDLHVRVFKLKLKALLDDLIKHGIFGHTIAHTWVVEFQKHGLPHAHILVILSNDTKPHTVIDFDSIVCAELPDPDADPELFRIVTTMMLHGPCGPDHPNSPCMEGGVCKKGFPKRFSEETVFVEDGYPEYHHHQSPLVQVEHHNGCSFWTNNSWVVPYNPFLSCKYNAHINVEICNSVHAVKYLYKYVYKGPDQTSMAVTGDSESTTGATSAASTSTQDVNEFENFVNA